MDDVRRGNKDAQPMHNLHPNPADFLNDYSIDPDVKMERRRQEDALGADIIDECRTQLMLKFRFLDMALWRMGLEPVRVGSHYPLATDGQSVLYDPPRVIARFQESFDESVRDYLHMIMHCIFRHPYDKNKRHKEVWDLTCDIIVENAVMDLCGNRFKSDDDLARMMALSRIKMAAGGMSPAKIYSLIENLERTADGQHFRGIGPSALAEWRSLFERDDHGAWPVPGKAEQSDETSDSSPDEEMSENPDNPDMTSESLRSDSQSPQQSQGEGDVKQPRQAQDDSRQSQDSNKDANDNAVEGAGPQAEAAPEGNSAETSPERNIQDNPSQESCGTQDGQDAESTQDEADSQDGIEAPSQAMGHSGSNHGGRDEKDAQDERARQDWEEISKQIEMNLHTFSKEWSDEAASFLANLQMANRKKYDYTAFLQRFMVPTEEMQLNMDEFDLTFYTFGMDMYGNMPFIEPLEYKETKRIRHFVIVIDTSESVRGELVRKFLERTFDILKSSEDYSSSVNIHLIQADDRVQSDTKITDLKDVDSVMANLAIRGFGGTDFRPAFDYVDMLVSRGELENLQGLLYFTDGFGQFPEKAPDFDAAFVFIDDGSGATQPVPPWAIKITIDDDMSEFGE